MNRKEKQLFEARLSALFETHKGYLKNPQQLEILKRGYVYSDVDYDAEVLVMGINPSQRGNFLNDDAVSYDYMNLEKDMYFKKFHELLKPYKNYRISYLDLFYQKHSEQSELKHFLKDSTGRAFLKSQLDLTRSQIRRIQPKLVLLFNRQAGLFFDSDWMDVSILDSNIEHLSRVQYTDTSLKKNLTYEFFIYFSIFIGYRTRRKSIEKLKEELPLIFKVLQA